MCTVNDGKNADGKRQRQKNVQGFCRNVFSSKTKKGANQTSSNLGFSEKIMNATVET